MKREPQDEPGLEEVEELEEVDGKNSHLDAAMREAVAAVEAVEKKKAGKKGSASGTSGQEGTPQGGAGSGSEADKEVERLQIEIASLRDTSMRTLADFENFRKRTDREKEETRRYALLDPMREFLPVIDNLERALAAEGRPEDLKQGVELILRQMKALLDRFAVKPVVALGERFDPSVHDAVMQEEDPEVKEPTVTEELQKGYVLHERLIRPAMVKVAMPAKPKSESSDA